MIGRTISKYRVIEELGRGGMGEVYLAEDTRVGRRVAIKLLPRRLAGDPGAKARFLREARAVAQLDHPYIVPLHEYDEYEGEPYFVTPYLAGGSLRQAMRSAADQPLPLDKSLRWAIQAAEGLAAAHARGVIHRDIKPDNLLLTEDGDLRICDFGLASMAEATRLTHTGTTMGTLGYMSPEQVRGQVVDHRSDLFSLGATLHEMLSGQAPFVGEDQAAVLHAVAYEEAADLREIRPDLPADLVEIVEELLRKDANERLDSAEETARRLREVAAAIGAERTMPLPVTAEHPSKPLGRKLAWLALVILGAMLIGWLVWQFVPRGSTPQEPEDSSVVEPVANKEDTPIRFAVLPFSVQGGEEIQGLAEGMGELISTRLHGAGALRRAGAEEDGEEQNGAGKLEEGPELPDRWPSDLAQARGLATELGVDLLVRGAVVEAAGQLHVSAEMYSADARSSPLAEATAEGPLEDLYRLLDELSIELLLGRLTPDEFTWDVASIQTESLPALKEYLTAEWRESNWGAIEACEKAVAQDPDFAIAWMCMARRYLAPMAGYDRAREAIARAWENSDRLTPQTQEHLRAIEAFVAGDAVKAEEICRGILSNDPDNFEAWYLLAATYRLISWKHGMRFVEGRAAVERLGELGMRVDWMLKPMQEWEQGNEELAIRLSTGPRVSRVFHDGGSALDSLLAEWREIETWILLRQPLNGFLPRDTPKAMDRAAALLLEDQRSREAQSYGHVILAHLRVELGRWSQAREEFLRARALDFPLGIEQHALLAATPFMPVPESELRSLREDLAAWDVEQVTPGSDKTPQLRIHDDHHAHLRLYLMAMLSAKLDEREQALALASQLEQLPGNPAVVALARDQAHGIRGRILWQQGRYAEALVELEQARYPSDPDYFFFSPFHIQSLERYLRAEVLVEVGRDEEALGWYPMPWSWGLEYVYLAPYHLRCAQIEVRRGNRDLARKHYARFLEYWGDAESELQPLVEDAQEEMQRLREEPAPGSGR